MRKFIVGSLLFILCSPFAVRADDDCEYINQRLALCSTHAYNIGKLENPTDAVTRQTMDDVVALKSTIITQQMKKQYDFLDTTVKRFKTQLEKAILTAQMQAAGAPATESSSSSTSSGNKQIPFSGAEDCSQIFSNKDKVACLQRNYMKIYYASNNKTRLDTAAKRQMEVDIRAMKNMTVGGVSANISEDCKKSYSSLTVSCLDEMQSAMANLNQALEEQEAKARYGK
ncbi:MAG: hypothetical protein FWF97_00830 [Alphaproteobacteria bacterium]|nr:hypothetical protein [Alphaproteobacteria bacterium]